jgi:hypothetical protein
VIRSTCTIQLFTPLAFGLSLITSFAFAEERITHIAPEPLTLQTANQLLDKFEALYQPLAVQAGKRLNLKRQFDSPIISANGTFNADSWNITVFGGLINHRSLSPESFVAVLCHEFGHALGGKPFISNLGSGKTKASCGGQADYYAAAYCMKAFWRDNDNAETLQHLGIDHSLLIPCQSQFESEKERALCGRILNAAQEMSRFVAELTGEAIPSLTKKDLSIAETPLINDHPPLQCRLDTFVAGALCRTLPTRNSTSERDSLMEACDQDRRSARPRCWYKP